MKEATELTTWFFNQENPWMIIVAAMLATPFLLKLLKEISTISHTIEIKNIEAFASSLTEDSNFISRYKLERTFEQLYKRSFSYNEIIYLLKNESPSTSIRNYILGFTYLEYDKAAKILKYRKNYPFKVISWVTGILFFVFSIISIIMLLILFLTFFIETPVDLFLNILFVLVVSFGVAVISIIESRGSSAAQRLVNDQSATELLVSSESTENVEIDDATNNVAPPMSGNALQEL